ncbi:hypothetical protein JZ751_010671, partial [Albula glossodonta]
MRDVYFTLALLVWSGYRINAISALSSVYLVRPGDDVVLPCNVTFNLHTLWFRQQSEDMIHLTTTARDNLNNRTIDEFHIDDNDRLSLYLDNHTKSISLKIIRVKESDQGWYYCTEWETGAVHFGKGVRLAFTAAPLPAWYQDSMIALAPSIEVP